MAENRSRQTVMNFGLGVATTTISSRLRPSLLSLFIATSSRKMPDLAFRHFIRAARCRSGSHLGAVS
eukprot:4837865-Pleurochrysis_carterae.AAC.1